MTGIEWEDKCLLEKLVLRTESGDKELKTKSPE